ncbi:hypothetical protein CVD28_08950 [Bacillus sp. M6-12]|uniref:S-layer homology domain-containing protein n=1 Tax=Bacillus sp. M6-12 TaxID=2054166 RepID=UPI000C782A20|nr:S-layer homology domain-containing protein [Bacillus sp. M6-12]PLS17817.1 hypothetical protein CVD28_08950 [Bacillus sp. M6-12]
MKKYPFSNKAVKAMLVASLAISPVVSTGLVIKPTNAEATVQQSYSNFHTLSDRLEVVFRNLSVADRAALQSFYEVVTDEELESLFDKIDATGPASSAEKEEFVQDINELLFAGATFNGVQEKLAAFDAKYTDQKVQEFLGQGITKQGLLNFIAAVEYNFFNSISADANLTVYYLTLLTSLEAVGSQDAYSSVYGAIKDSTQITIENREAILSQISSYQSHFNGEVRTAINNIVTAIKNAGTGGGGGGGGVVTPPVTPPTTPEAGDVVANPGSIAQNPAAVVDAIKNATNFDALVIAATGNSAVVELPQSILQAVADKNSSAVIEVKNDKGSYELPVSEIKLADLAKELGVDAKDVKISITVAVTTDSANVLGQNNLKSVAPILDFEVTAKGPDGKTVSVVKTKFSGYVDRTIVGDAAFNANQSTGVRLNADGTFASLPTFFDGKNAVIKSQTNSKYTVVQNSKTFKDVDNGKNWAEASIEKLASKYVISGKTADSYAPNDFMTRGEFAALISRSLGLVATDAKAVKFSDVSTNQALNKNGEIAAAVEAKIIFGKKDGKFHPSEKITRAEAAMMISRAMDYAKASDKDLDKSKKLAALKDLKKIGTTSRSSVEKVLQAGIMSGYSNGNFGPNDNTKRDQMATILDKLLQFIKFSN